MVGMLRLCAYTALLGFDLCSIRRSPRGLHVDPMYTLFLSDFSNVTLYIETFPYMMLFLVSRTVALDWYPSHCVHLVW